MPIIKNNSVKNQHVKIKVKTSNGIEIVAIEDVLYIEANTPYAYIYLKKGERIFCSDSLKVFEERLKYFGFFRINKQYLINVSCVVKLIKNGEPYVQMYGDVKLKLSRSKKHKFYDYLDRFYF